MNSYSVITRKAEICSDSWAIDSFLANALARSVWCLVYFLYTTHFKLSDLSRCSLTLAHLCRLGFTWTVCLFWTFDGIAQIHGATQLRPFLPQRNQTIQSCIFVTVAHAFFFIQRRVFTVCCDDLPLYETLPLPQLDRMLPTKHIDIKFVLFDSLWYHSTCSLLLRNFLPVLASMLLTQKRPFSRVHYIRCLNCT